MYFFIWKPLVYSNLPIIPSSKKPLSIDKGFPVKVVAEDGIATDAKIINRLYFIRTYKFENKTTR